MLRSKMVTQNLLERKRMESFKEPETAWIFWKNSGIIFTIGLKIVTNLKAVKLSKTYKTKIFTKLHMQKTLQLIKYTN